MADRRSLLHLRTSRPLLLDLFCGAGGCSVGYERAGFEVVGVDIKPQPRYPFEFHQADALEVLAVLVAGREWEGYRLEDFAAIHASPPCQAHSTLGSLWKDRTHPDLVAPTRELVKASGLPYVIENVVGAPLENPIMLCGSTFGLGANGRQLRRHRLFESNVGIMAYPCQHVGQPVGVYGHGGGGSMTRGYKGTGPEYRDAMGMHWPGLTKQEIAQAIPPAYTEHIGGYLIAALEFEAAA